jgi:RimJ/RimL family protein N-acetyltransferase
MNADERTMRFMPGVLTREETRDLTARFEAHHATHGFGVWALERRDTGALVGYTGLQWVSFEAAFTPAIEIAWRLAPEFWHHGYATEAAHAALADGFDRLGLERILAFTVPANAPSRAVMDRLGMTRDERLDFDHPRLPAGHSLSRHVVYALTREAWRAARSRDANPETR